ncbi:MAG: hypothetical protein ABJB66_15090 [Gemmatimonadaceae bacterium]
MSLSSESLVPQPGWLSTYAEQDYQFVVAAPGIDGPFSDVDDFRRRALAHTMRPARLYAPFAHSRFRIVVPNDYAQALDAVRRMRALVNGQVVDAAPSGTELDVTLLNRALPEDIAELIAMFPAFDVLDVVILCDDVNPADAWYSQEIGHSFASAASATLGMITLYRAPRDEFLRDTFFHELAHLLGERYEMEFAWFTIASGIERGGFMHRDRASVSIAENWAVHLGECTLGESDEAFENFCREAPVRAATLGIIMDRMVNSLSTIAIDNTFVTRTTWLHTNVRAAAENHVRTNIERCHNTGESDRESFLLLLVLADGKPVAGFETRSLVELGGAAIGRKVLLSLASFTSLESLDVSNTFIGRGGLETLPRLAQLRELNLSGTRIFSSDVRYIGELVHLKRLDIGSTNVNVSAFPELARMRGLRYLRITGTELASDAAALRTALPACEVVA